MIRLGGASAEGQTSARRLQTIGDIIEAFEGNEADGKEARPPEHPAEANDESEEPKAIVESMLMSNCLNCWQRLKHFRKIYFASTFGYSPFPQLGY